MRRQSVLERFGAFRLLLAGEPVAEQQNVVLPIEPVTLILCADGRVRLAPKSGELTELPR